MARVIDVEFRLRTDPSVIWAAKNPILGKDEPGFDSTVGNFKMGDGYTHWNNLDWFLSDTQAGNGDPESVLAALQDHINSLTPHPVYDDGPSFALFYENAKV